MFEQSLALGSTSGATLWLEPWGDCIELPKGRTIRVNARGNRDGCLEVVHGPDSITIWAWNQAVLQVVDCNDQLLWPPGDDPWPLEPPPTPDGLLH